MPSIDLLKSCLPMKPVSLGYTTIHIYELAQIEEAQLGYAYDLEGNSFVSEEPGDWQAAWLVIGYEDLCGDPIFVDSQADGFPVYTAIHGAGSWNPEMIATSLQNFADALKIIEEVARGREYPVKLKRNPISSDEKEKALADIYKINPGIETEFWELWLGV